MKMEENGHKPSRLFNSFSKDFLDSKNFGIISRKMHSFFDYCTKELMKINGGKRNKLADLKVELDLLLNEKPLQTNHH